MRTLAAISIVVLIAVLLPSAQTKTPKTFAVRTNLMVLDEKNEIVRNLKSSDIKIFESGIEQEITSFVEIENASDISIVADTSGSVRTQLDDIIGIGKIIVANLGPRDNTQIIRFVDSETIEVTEPWTKDRARLDEALSYLYVEGGQSAVIDALYLAASDLLKRNSDARRQAIILISDGEDRDSYYSEKELFDLLEKKPIQIFTITLTKELPKGYWDLTPGRKPVGVVVRFVNKLAATTGGTSFIIKKDLAKADLTESLKALMTELQSQYIVGYTSQAVKKDNNVRKLTATVADGPNGEKRKVHIKDTVIVVPGN